MSKVKYFSLRPIKKIGRAFNIIIGGRGVGKTFNCINDLTDDMKDEDDKFIYMRRTQNEIDLIGSDDENVSVSPFAKINRRSNDPKFGLIPKQYTMSKVNKNIWAVYNYDQLVCQCLALSTIARIRGFDADAYTSWIYDEFIPEKHVHKLGKGDAEGEAILNAYETINRDRELVGQPALQLFLCSNAFDISHPFLDMMGFTEIIERMRRKGQHFVDLPAKSATIMLYDDAEYKEARKKTALWMLTKGTNFAKMAFDNEFIYNDFSLIKSMPLIEYRPYCSIDGVYIYEHKSNGTFYVTSHPCKCETFSNSDHDVQNFYLNYGRFLYGAYVNGDLIFENYSVKHRVLELID